LTGALTSNFDGSIINENVDYAAKTDVYLTGGPCNGGSHQRGRLLLSGHLAQRRASSSDAIGQSVTVANDYIQSATGRVTHAVNCNPPVTGITVQLYPSTTRRTGGEYKLTVATASSVEVQQASRLEQTFEICGGADQKSDNYKVACGIPRRHRRRPGPRR
jgi:hypothetical protein